MQRSKDIASLMDIRYNKKMEVDRDVKYK